MACRIGIMPPRHCGIKTTHRISELVTRMKPLKYRPSLSAQEITDCVEALEIYNIHSTALKVLRVFLFKQSQDMVTPTNISGATGAIAARGKSIKSDRDLPQDAQEAMLRDIEAKARQAQELFNKSKYGLDHKSLNDIASDINAIDPDEL